MSTWPWWTPCAPTVPWGPSWSPHPRYCSRRAPSPRGRRPALLAHLGCFRGTHLPPPPLSWPPGGVRGGREAGADLLQEGGAAGDRACGEHERLCLPPLLGESWEVAGVGSHPRPPRAEKKQVDPVSLSQECTNVFSKGGGEELARHAGVPFLGEWAGAAPGPYPLGRGERGLPPTPPSPRPARAVSRRSPVFSSAGAPRRQWGLLGILGRFSLGASPAGPRQCCPRAPGLRGWTGPPSLALTAHSPCPRPQARCLWTPS